MITIEGNLGSIYEVADALRRHAKQEEPRAHVLNKVVRGLIDDNNWSGEAAESFHGAWGQDAGATVELAQTMDIAAGVLERLAQSLSSAKNALADAYDAAAKAKVIMVNGVPASTQPSAEKAQAGTEFNQAAAQALSQAKTARENAASELGALLGEINPDVDKKDFPNVAQVSGLGALLRGYYSLPSGLSEKVTARLKASEARLAELNSRGLHVKGLTPEGQAELRAMRAVTSVEVKDLKGIEARAEKIAKYFAGGKALGTSVADMLPERAARLSRLGEAVPVLDVAAGALATWDMAKHDHEKGWSWMHSIAVEGGANATGIALGTAADFIPYVGPVAGPVAGYGGASYVSELFHEGHWEQNMHDHGVLAPLYIEGDATKAVLKNDIIGVGSSAAHAATHPVEAAKSLWHEAKWLV